MACSNCKCQDAEPTQPAVDNMDELTKGVRHLVFVAEKLREQIADVNLFLHDKFPQDLVDGAGVRVTASYYVYHKNRRAEEARQLEETIRELQEKGYVVAKPEAPTEPTLEASIRDVVLANTVVK
jgi:hypothetical protein